MQDVNVIVVFRGSAEPLALAAAVGAVQGRANIRLRRLLETDGETDQEYVAPRDADAEWADAILIGMDAVPVEFEGYLKKLEGKIGASFTTEAALGAASLFTVMERAGLIPVPAVSGNDATEAARLQGRRVADMARSRRRKV